MFFKLQVSFLKCTIIQLKGGRLQGRASLNLTSERLEPHEESFLLILNLMSWKASLSRKSITIFLWSISSYLPQEFVFISIINPLTIKSWPGICAEKAMAPHFSTLAWKIPWTEEPGRLQSMGLLRVGHDWMTSLSLFTFMHCRRKWQPTPVFLPGESQGRGSLVGCRLWGLRVGHDWSDLAAAAADLKCPHHK